MTFVSDRRTIAWTLLGLALVVWTQSPALGAFFSSPDDLVHLQQAAGLRPIAASPFRFLSQVAYFRVMLDLFGPQPIVFHVVSLLVHGFNVWLVAVLAARLGAPRLVAACAAMLFGCFPLFYPLFASAVGMNDELALMFMLLALLALHREGGGWAFAAWLTFVTAMLCKESVIAMPLLALMAPAGSTARRQRAWPLIGTSVVFAGLLMLAPPQGLSPYALEFGANVWHNLMTYAAWAINVTRPLPDRVSSFDPQAWRTGIWLYLAIGAAWWRMRSERRQIGLGIAWWLIALLPVLGLRFQTYRHYLYPALPGLCLAVAVVVARVLSRVTARSPAPGAERTLGRVAAGILLVGIVAYALQAQRLILARRAARIPGTELAFDPFTRRQEVARNAVESLAHFLPPSGPVHVAVFSPPGAGRMFGARSGREYAVDSLNRPPGPRPYDLLEESLDHGGVVRLFFPRVDSVRFIDRWTPAVASYQLFLPFQNGRLKGVGAGIPAHVRAARWMFEQGWFARAADYLGDVIAFYPMDPDLRLARGFALIQRGDPAGARAELREVLRLAPNSEAAAAARGLLDTP